MSSMAVWGLDDEMGWKLGGSWESCAGEQLRCVKLSGCWCWVLGVLFAGFWGLGFWVLRVASLGCWCLSSGGCVQNALIGFGSNLCWETRSGSTKLKDLAEGKRTVSSPCGVAWDLPNDWEWAMSPRWVCRELVRNNLCGYVQHLISIYRMRWLQVPALSHHYSMGNHRIRNLWLLKPSMYEQDQGEGYSSYVGGFTRVEMRLYLFLGPDLIWSIFWIP